MEFIKEWITNIILFVLLATVIDMLLPNSNLQKYTKMVTGLLLIAVILTPIFKLISNDFEESMAKISIWDSNKSGNIENLIENKKTEIQSTQQAYILETMAVQLEKDAKEELMDQYGLTIAKIDFLLNEDDQQAFPENLKKVIVKLEQPESTAEAVAVVEPVDISTSNPLPSKRANENEYADIASLLSQKWDIKEQTIEIEMVEGGKQSRMDNDKGPISRLKKLLSNNHDPTGKKPGKYQYLVLVLIIGAAIMLISNLFMNNTASNELPVFNNEKDKQVSEDVPAFGQKSTKQNDIIKTYEDAYENQLKEALEGIQGVGDVTVVVNVDATEKQVLEKNSKTQTQTTDETDREGGKRNVEDSSKEDSLVIIREGENEVPIVVETKKPEIRGVLIVAKGADNIQVKKWIVEAVTRALDVPSHRVAVMPKKG